MRATIAPPAAPPRAGEPSLPVRQRTKIQALLRGKGSTRRVPSTRPRRSRSPATDRRLQTLFAAVRECVDEKGWVKALLLFREMARLHPGNGATQHNLGVACLTVGLSAEAAPSLERAAQLRSEKSLPFLVEALEVEGRGSEAARICRRLSRAAVNAHDRRRYLARALLLETRLKEAEQELRPLLAVGPPDPSTRLLFAKLLLRHLPGRTDPVFSSCRWRRRRAALRFWRTWSSGAVAAIPPLGALSKATEDYLAALRQIAPDAAQATGEETSNFELLGLLRLALPQARIFIAGETPSTPAYRSSSPTSSGRYSYLWDRGDLVFAYRQYERLMEHWRRALSPDQLTRVQYETLIADREAETRRLVAFCGLEWDDACLAPELNGRVVATASVWQARQPVCGSSIERWRRYEPWLGELRELMPAGAAKSP